jgi:hypothetical protein
MMVEISLWWLVQQGEHTATIVASCSQGCAWSTKLGGSQHILETDSNNWKLNPRNGNKARRDAGCTTEEQVIFQDDWCVRLAIDPLEQLYYIDLSLICRNDCFASNNQPQPTDASSETAAKNTVLEAKVSVGGVTMIVARKSI